MAPRLPGEERQRDRLGEVRADEMRLRQEGVARLRGRAFRGVVVVGDRTVLGGVTGRRRRIGVLIGLDEDWVGCVDIGCEQRRAAVGDFALAVDSRSISWGPLRL
jgi:hypothetical protein